MSDRSGGAEFFAGLVIGGLVGATLALLLAPQSGEETRAQIRDKSLELKGRAEEGYMQARQTIEGQLAGLQEQMGALQQQMSNLQSKVKIPRGKGEAESAA
ncbi:MAG: YtxH domain-containing protein [Anaerolineae bacterium]|nr:YtxH domain-containing protein [Anaerolineae bacterium]